MLTAFCNRETSTDSGLGWNVRLVFVGRCPFNRT